MFDPAGRFLRTFGSQGTADGRFNYPWGITTDALGFIYVCDKENHRVQVIIFYKKKYVSIFAGYCSYLFINYGLFSPFSKKKVLKNYQLEEHNKNVKVLFCLSKLEKS